MGSLCTTTCKGSTARASPVSAATSLRPSFVQLSQSTTRHYPDDSFHWLHVFPSSVPVPDANVAITCCRCQFRTIPRDPDLSSHLIEACIASPGSPSQISCSNYLVPRTASKIAAIRGALEAYDRGSECLCKGLGIARWEKIRRIIVRESVIVGRPTKEANYNWITRQSYEHEDE